MDPPLEITASRPHDLPRLFALAEITFADMPGWNARRVVRALNEDVVFVARERDALAGYVALRRESERSLLIEQLLVTPAYQRRGVGRRLLAYAEGYAVTERVPALRVVVETSNHRARDLYRRLGFVPEEPEIFRRSLPYVA
jgi:ribosomal protein S18 acetylase RimI-like enzyme